MLPADLLAKINADSDLLSVLYDLDLMPEQVMTHEQEYMCKLVSAAFLSGREAEKRKYHGLEKH